MKSLMLSIRITDQDSVNQVMEDGARNLMNTLLPEIGIVADSVEIKQLEAELNPKYKKST